MRLPIEDDWRPKLSTKDLGDNEYEKHVELLASRLHEASKVAGRQSALSHETAKRYYDRQTKLNQFKKGDLVYVHDPTYKRGKAKKFSYQYKGPFEVEQKISLLIYKVRMADGTSAVLHVNRLKRAYGQRVERDNALPLCKSLNKTVKLGKLERSSPRDVIESGSEESDAGIPSHSRSFNVEINEQSEESYGGSE